MAEQETAQVDETRTPRRTPPDAGLVEPSTTAPRSSPVAAGAAATDAPVADNRSAVAEAEQHLEENTDLAPIARR